MATYSAQIQVGVTGQRELEQLRSQITKVNTAIDSLNQTRIEAGGLTQSLSNYQTQLARTTRGLAEAQLGTGQYNEALKNYVTALGLANTAEKQHIKNIDDATRAAMGLQTQEERNIEVLQRFNKIQSGRFRQKQLQEEAEAAQKLTQELEDANRAWQMFEHKGKLQYAAELEEAAAAFKRFKDETISANTALEAAIQTGNRLARIQQSVATTQERQSVERSAAMMRTENMARLYREQNPISTTPLLPFGNPTLPSVRGGARTVGQQREILGGARTADEAAATLRWAAATDRVTASVQETHKYISATTQEILDSAAALEQFKQKSQAETANVLSRARLREQETQQLYRQAQLADKISNAYGYSGKAPALRPAGMSDAQVAELNRKTPQRGAVSGGGGGTNRLESLALGAGFPLMFGAGPGMLAGSIAGSFAGSGFGGQIVGGALGQKFDELGTAAADFSRSLREGGDAAGYLTEKLGYLNPETKTLIQNLQQSGQTARAAAMAQQELGKVIGPQAAKDLKQFGDLWDYVGTKFKEFTLITAAGIPKLAEVLPLLVPGGFLAKGAIGKALSGVGVRQEAPETQAAQNTTAALRDQLTVSKANYTVTQQNAMAQGAVYIAAKQQALQTEKIAAYNKIDAAVGSITPEQRRLEISKLNVEYTTKSRDLEKEKLQLLEQQNQTIQAVAQINANVGITRQQTQLAQEQYTATEQRRASLRGSILIQQALNSLEAVNLRLAQERQKTQKDINTQRIATLEAERTLASTQLDQAKAEATNLLREADKVNAENRIKLDQQVYDNQVELLRLRYELEKQYIEGVADLQASKLQGAARDQANRFNQLQKDLRQLEEGRRSYAQKVEEAKRVYAVEQSRLTMPSAAVPSGAAASVGKAPIPEYIPKEQLRKWLESQGFGRTSGDFTNKGHETPNHMLNAMDMGIIGGSDAEALRRTSELERRLRATGAFGNQLFGPISDPYGHGAGKGGQNIHAHIPTPGGRVRMTPGLAKEMNLLGGNAALPMSMQVDGRVGGGGAFAGDTTQLDSAKLALDKTKQAMMAVNTQTENSKKLALDKYIQSTVQSYEDQTYAVKNQTEALQLKTRLELEGVNPIIIDGELQKLQISRDLDAQLSQINQTTADGKLATEAATVAAQAQAAAVDQLTQAALASQNKLIEYTNQLRTQLNDTEGMIVNLAGTIQNELSTAMSTAVTGVIQGTTTVQQAFSQMFANIGQAFIQMATQMITKALALKVLGIFLPGAGGGGGGGLPGFGGGDFGGAGMALSGIPMFANGGTPPVGRASLVGERGPELFVPRSSGTILPADATAAMARYQRRAGATPGGGGAEGGTTDAGTPVLSMSFETTRFLDRDWVDKDQLEKAMAATERRATAAGAKAGAQQVSTRLLNSPGYRRQVGLR